MALLFKEEFQAKRIQLKHPYPEDFVCCQWKWNPWIIGAYRILITAFCATFLIFNNITFAFLTFDGSASNQTNISRKITDDKSAKDSRVYFIYVFLTIWSYTILTCYFLIAAINWSVAHLTWYGKNACIANATLDRQHSNLTAHTLMNDSRNSLGNNSYENNNYLGFHNSSSIDWSFTYESGNHFHPNARIWLALRLQWLLFSIASDAAILVTLGYFGFLYRMVNPNGGISFVDLCVHALNTLFVFIEISVNAQPVRLGHVFFTMLYSMSYLIFSVIFWALDHKNIIYPIILDWNHPLIPAILSTFLICVGVPGIHAFVYGLYRLRLTIFKALYMHKYHEARL